MLSEQLKGSTLPNLWDTHPPFQIDGNFGATAGIVEMLLQSQHGELHLLPALPPTWPTGRATGLRARGDLTVDITWAAGKAQEATVTAGHTGPVTLRRTPTTDWVRVTERDTSTTVPLSSVGERVTFDAQAGHSYVLTTVAEPRPQRR
jgi:alpha-L-fucosidase 2